MSQDDKPLRGPPRPLDYWHDWDMNMNPPQDNLEVTAGVDLGKPMRGHTTPIVYWDDHDYMNNIESSKHYSFSIEFDPEVLKADIPEGWYDNCFPTKELHDQWFAALNAPPSTSTTLNFMEDWHLTENSKPTDVDHVLITPDHVTYPTIYGFFKQWQEVIKNYNDSGGEINLLPIWYRPRVPNKLSGRKGTRKGWKKRNPPRWLYLDPRRIEWVPFGEQT